MMYVKFQQLRSRIFSNVATSSLSTGHNTLLIIVLPVEWFHIQRLVLITPPPSIARRASEANKTRYGHVCFTKTRIFATLNQFLIGTMLIQGAALFDQLYVIRRLQRYLKQR